MYKSYLELKGYSIEIWEAKDRIIDKSEDAAYVYNEDGECIGALGEFKTLLFNNGDTLKVETIHDEIEEIIIECIDRGILTLEESTKLSNLIT